MKRFSFGLVMLALALAYGLAFSSCDDGSGGGKGNNQGGGNQRVTGISISNNTSYGGVYSLYQQVSGKTATLYTSGLGSIFITFSRMPEINNWFVVYTIDNNKLETRNFSHREGYEFLVEVENVGGSYGGRFRFGLSEEPY